MRKDYLNKISTEIVKNHDLIGIENLPESYLFQNKYLDKLKSERFSSTFKSMLEYIAKWYGKQVAGFPPR